MAAAPTVALPALNRDLKNAAKTLGPSEVRFLVDQYYTVQDYRKASGNQVIALRKTDEPHETVAFLHNQFEHFEKQVKDVLDVYSAHDPVGQLARDVKGIGPVIAAGLIAHIDFTKPTVGHIWRFAGLDPTMKWEKGQKRPYNARLKVLCWKIGDSFVKFSGHEDCRYGQFYRQRKEFEIERDLSVQEVDEEGWYDLGDGTKVQAYRLGEKWFVGGNAKSAHKALTEKKIQDKDLLATLHSGHLPDGQLDLRARRWAVKLFLAHLHELAFKELTGEDPPLPYPIAIQGHAHYIAP